MFSSIHKKKKKMLFITNEELKNQIPTSLIPDYLGGSLKIDHSQWLAECQKLITSQVSTSSSYYFYSTVDSLNKEQFKLLTSRKRQQSNSENNDHLDEEKQVPKKQIHTAQLDSIVIENKEL